METEEDQQQEGQPRGRLARAGSILLWYVFPALALGVVIAYIAAAVVLDVNPPVVPVVGTSMRPTLQAGDLVFLKGVDPRTLRKGEIIAFQVPKASQQQYHLPGALVHRIIGITHTDAGLTFQTKGDANPGPDVFKIHGGDVSGRMIGRAPGLGFPILFFRSSQGKIFLGAAALVALIYFLIGLFEERHEYVAGTTLGLQEILNETEQLKRLIEQTGPVAQQRSAGGAPDVATSSLPIPAVARAPAPGPADPPLTALAAEVRSSNDQSRETTATIRELVGAISEYGEHLRSHTAIMEGLAATTGNLERATSELAAVIPAPAEPPAAVESPVKQPPGASPAESEPSDTVPPPPAPVSDLDPRTDPQGGYDHPVPPSRRKQMLTIVLSELQSPTLTRSFRGYAVDPVERLLAQAAAALEDSVSDGDELRGRLEIAEQQLAHYHQLEADMSQALIAAERNLHELTTQMERRTESVLLEVRASARAIVQEALGERRPVPGEHDLPAVREPRTDDRGLRGMLARAREQWRAASAHTQPPAPPPPEDPNTRP